MNVLQGIARLAIAAPRRIIAVALLLMVGAGIFGIPVSKSLSAGGLQDPASESWQAARLLSEKFGQGDMHMVIAVTSEAGAESLAARAVGADLVRGLQASPHVADVNSAWTASPPDAATMISKDGKTGLIIAGITGGENGAQTHAKQLADQLVHDRNGVTVRAGGDAMTRVADQQPERKRPAADGIDRRAVELRGAGLGVRRRAGGGAATGGGRVRDPRLRWRCCARSHTPPTCRSSR